MHVQNQDKVKIDALHRSVMDGMRVFISYSSEDKKMVGAIDSALKTLRVEPFLAHKDNIEGGSLWKEAVRNTLCECDILVALITPNVRKSKYAEQEVGAVWAQKNQY